MSTHWLVEADTIPAPAAPQENRRGSLPVNRNSHLLPRVAAILRAADVHLAARRSAVRPHRPPPDHGPWPHAASHWVHMGRRPRHTQHQLGRAHGRAAHLRDRHLDGAADRPDRSPQRRLPGTHGEGRRHQLHGPALRCRVRDRDRQRRLLRQRPPRHARQRHRRLPAGALGLRRLRRPRRADRVRHQPAAHQRSPPSRRPSCRSRPEPTTQSGSAVFSRRCR
jgi:hypothetical protein